jgi:CTD kinase subunit beta
METILDLLEHYTHFQKSSAIGSSYPIDTFINTRIRINKELEHEFELARYTEQHEAPKINGKLNIKTPKTPITPASPSDLRINGKDVASPATVSPRSGSSGKRGTGARGQEGTVRFMLDGEEAKKEKAAVDEYFKVEYEEYEVEVEEPIKHERVDHHYRHHNGRDERHRGHYSKRGRR